MLFARETIPNLFKEFPDEAESEYGEIATILKLTLLAEVIFSIVFRHF
jgi:hypothetical protein